MERQQRAPGTGGGGGLPADDPLTIQNLATANTWAVTNAAGGYVSMSATQTFLNAPGEVLLRTSGSTRLSVSPNLVSVPGTELRLSNANAFVAFSSSGVTIRPGAGSPEGVTTAPVGSVYPRTNGDPETALYVKGAGTGNTGWVAVATRVSVPGGPTDYGYKTWSYDPTHAVNSSSPTAGSVRVVRLECRQADTWTGLNIGVVSVAGMSLTAGQCFLALYNSAGTRVGVSADLSATIAAAGELAVNFTSPVSVTPGFYWAAILLNGSSLPTFARAQGQISDLGQGQLTAAASRFGRADSGATAMPATITPASIARDVTTNFWVAAR